MTCRGAARAAPVSRAQSGKVRRQQTAAISRRNKRQALITQLRAGGAEVSNALGGGAPRTVGVISLGARCDPAGLIEMVTGKRPAHAGACVT